MRKRRKLFCVMFVLILAAGFVGCNDDNNGTTTVTSTSDLVTITWNNQTAFTVDFFLDGVFAQEVISGQTGTTTGVSKGTHLLMGCRDGFEPQDADDCEGEQFDITTDFRYTMN